MLKTWFAAVPGCAEEDIFVGAVNKNASAEPVMEQARSGGDNVELVAEMKKKWRRMEAQRGGARDLSTDVSAVVTRTWQVPQLWTLSTVA
jgi:hypothetical protein